MEESVAIRASHLSKKYTIGSSKNNSLRHTLGDFFTKKQSSTEEFWALKDVNFSINKGDVVGIIGKNGAGKSTLLKILSQITKPTEGKIEINGRIASLLEVGTGFHHELTGRENIFLNGTILGMTRKEVAAKFDEIVEFSGVGKFIDTPVKHYSSGMYVRLAFAVAAHLEPEILVVDEVLAVGDAEFQKKCLGKMQDVAGQGRTVLFVSHNMGAVSTLCNKGIVMSGGNVKYTGHIDDAIDFYIEQGTTSSNYKNDTDQSSKEVYFESVTPISETEEHISEFKTSQDISLEIKFHNIPNYSKLVLGVAVLDKMKNKIFTNHFNLTYERLENRVRYSIPRETLCPGKFSFDLALFDSNTNIHHLLTDVCEITVIDSGTEMYNYEGFGNVFVKCNWHEMDN